MATNSPKGNETAENVEAEPVLTEKANKVIPSQASGYVKGVSDVNGEPPVKEKIVNRVKALVTNKRVVASASSILLIAAGVAVVRKRNTSADEVEDQNVAA